MVFLDDYSITDIAVLPKEHWISGFSWESWE